MNPQQPKSNNDQLAKSQDKKKAPPLYIDELKQEKKSEQLKIRKIKTIVLGLMATLLILYLVFLQKEILQAECIFDRCHSATNFANDLLHTSPTFRFWMVLVGQEFIDIASISLLVLQVFRIRNFWPGAWLLGFYLSRAILLNLTKMPYPKGFIFESPGIPSFAVPYGVARDFFYSGHTGFMTFCCSLWSSTPSKFMKYFMVIGTIQVIAMLLITRVHYSIDIFAGFLFSRWFTMIITGNQLIIDKVFTAIVQAITQTVMRAYRWIVTKITINFYH